MSMLGTPVVLAAENVSYVYENKYQKVQALREVSCNFEAGKFYAIVGHSGSGKTTLLSLLAGLGEPSSGQVLAGGRPVAETGSERHRRENVSVIYQAFNLFQDLNILENVMCPMELAKVPAKEAKARARDLLALVGLGDVSPRKLPAMLSGGQQQRVAIARALASQARVILADEPTGNLDTENGQLVVDLLKRLVKEENYCVIVVTHDLDLAAQADVVYRMKDGALEEER
ncbi:ABC transporter ATP-binding protein [Acutalibacter caecimuris]|uniref:ABC transporter ATP-binding protein n=1 Tax=Acutalibacter caecimuris TaxID=3093657 RepID=UPI002AC990E3|nr:ABC transporter ATP-binding protein [Acutalibacter sp. M00118]